MKVLVDDIVVNYQTTGSGKAILMLHGWGSDLKTFDKLSSDLSKYYQIVRLDLPGFGQSELPPTDWDLAHYVDFVADFITKRKLTVYAIVAHSLGGRIAISGVGAGKLKPKRLVLLSSHGIRESRTLKARLLWLSAKVGRAVTVVLPANYRNHIKKRLYQAAGSDDYLNAGPLKQIFTRIVNEDVRPEAAMINVPTLLIYGEEDKVTPVIYGEAFHKLIQHSRFEKLSGAAHYVHLDQPALVYRLIAEFIK